MDKQKNTPQEVPNIHSEHIKEEFYKWFESRGLLSDLRAYMRQLMVKALEESNKNGRSIRQRKSSTSPKLQAVNLLVIDYLFHEDHLYTVSVFASEAQILDSLPQYSQYVTQTVRERRWDPSSMPRFSQQETEDILDTLRLPPTQRERQEATNLYISGQESLLTCIVRTLGSSHNQSFIQEQLRSNSLDDAGADLEVECCYQLWSREMQNLLLLAGVKIQHIRRMQQKWAQLIEEEREKAKKEAESELMEQQRDWQQETEQRLRAEVVEQMRAEQQTLTERQSRVELREQGLASLAEQLTAVHDDINERLSQLQLQSEELRARETRLQSDRLELDQRLGQLQVREQHLLLSYTGFREQAVELHCGEREERPKLEDNAELSSTKPVTIKSDASVQVNVEEHLVVSKCTQTPEPVTVAYTQTVDTVDHDQQTSLASEVDPELAHQMQTDREKINELQEENLELRAHALQQRHRIDELTNRAAGLSSQLEDTQVALAVLGGRDGTVVTPPPPIQQNPPVFITPTFGFNTPQRIGAGEESLFALRPPQTPPRPDSRRRPLRFAFSQNPSTTSEESSPTDEVIQNARARIQQLEQESAEVQRSYQSFQTRLIATDSVIFPPLGASRVRNPLLRVRRSDILPFMPLSNAPYPSFSLNTQPSQPVQIFHDENEESSSDQAGLYERTRVDSMTNARRMFSQRNMKQFERWKQFKKKFQKRDAFDHSRRSASIAINHTSSEDDEDHLRNNIRRRRELIKTKKTNDGRNFDSNSKNQKPEENHVTFEHNKSKIKEPNAENELPNVNPPLNNAPERANVTNLNSNTSVGSITNMSKDVQSLQKDRTKLKLEVERTEKLIESVKILLSEQSLNQGSTLSSGSLPEETLPRVAWLEMKKTENSPVLIVSPIQNKVNDKAINKEERVDTNVGSPIVKALINHSQHRSLDKEASEHSNVNISDNMDKEEVFNVQDINPPQPLSTLTLRLDSPRQNTVNEDVAHSQAFQTIDVAGHVSEDRGTTSATSGSDILRELNPSKSESNSSLISAGCAEDSKHSSDFWN